MTCVPVTATSWDRASGRRTSAGIPTIDGLGAQLVMPGFVHVDPAQPVRGAMLGQPLCGRGAERIRDRHAGVGLGLTIVRSIAQAHEGTLTLTPRAAGGLRITVQLPAAPPHTGG